MSKKIFRFDDICLNADMDLHIKIAELIKEKIPSAEVIFCVSPLVHNMIAEEDIEGAGEYMTVIFNRVWSLECTCKLTPNLEGC